MCQGESAEQVGAKQCDPTEAGNDALDRLFGAALLMLLASNVTAVCDSALPFSFAPVFIVIAVLPRMMPLNTDVVARVVAPPTCQKTYRAWAPPLSRIWVPALILRVPAICM